MSSRFERSRRPHDGVSRTNNFVQWSQQQQTVPRNTSQKEGQLAHVGSSPHDHYQEYAPLQPYQAPFQYHAPQQFNHSQLTPEQQLHNQQTNSYSHNLNTQYQHQHQHQPGSYHPSPSPMVTYGFKQHNLPHPQAPQSYQRRDADINELKSKIIQSRVRNLALKRAIVQRSLQGNGDAAGGGAGAAVRSSSASSTREDAAKNSAGQDPPFSDAISDLEAQLEQLRKDQLDPSREEKSEAVHEPSAAAAVPKRNERRKSVAPVAEKEEKKQPVVPPLRLGTEQTGEKAVENEKEEEEEEEEEDEDKGWRSKKRKARQAKQAKRNTEQDARETEALTKALDKIMGDVNNEIETNEGLLGAEKRVVSSRVAGGLNAPLDSYRMRELRRNEERKKRAEARSKIDSLLNNESLEFKIPRWKHEMNGNMNPKPEQVLKGIGLFRMAVRMVLYFYAKPIVRVRVMRIMGRDVHKQDLTKAVLLALDTCTSWLTSAIKVPLNSIMQDQTLNFSGLQTKDVKGKKDFHQQCNLQLKVRMTAMVTAITSIAIEDVPPHIKSFLERLVTDGNFFRTDFLYAFERASLEFDQLGATNNVSKSLSPEEISEIRKKHLAMKQRDPEQMMQAEGEDDLLEVGDLTYLLTRSKLLIRNFLFLRVLITNGLLSPWDHGIGSKPLPKQKKIIDNLRMTASIFYAMLKLYQPNMAHVVAASRRLTIQRMKSGRYKSHSSNRATILAPDSSSPRLIIKRASSVVDAKDMDEKVENKDDGSNGEDTTEKISAPTDVAGSKKKYELPVWFSSFADKVLGEAQALNLETDDATSFLLHARPPFDNDIEHLHVFLFGYDQELGPAKHLIDPWMKDLARRLDAWLHKLTVCIVREMKVKYQQDHNI